MRSKEYIIHGVPVAWKRARLSAIRRFYDGQIDEKALYALKLKQLHGEEPLFTGPMRIDMLFNFNKVTSKGKVKPDYHTNYPDIDNLQKFVLDAIKNVLIKDDRFVCSVTADKTFDKTNWTRITITELE